MVNTHLYGAHLASEGAVLPEHDVVIFDEAHEVEDVMIAAFGAEEHKQRGVVHLQMEQIRAAKADFEHYLELAPDAPDRTKVEQQVTSLSRWLVGMN